MIKASSWVEHATIIGRGCCEQRATTWQASETSFLTRKLRWISLGSPRISPSLPGSPLARTYGNDSSRDFASFTVCLAYTNKKYKFGEVDDCFGDESLRLNRPLDVARWVTDDRVALVDQCKRQTGSGLLDRIWEEVAKGEVVAK